MTGSKLIYGSVHAGLAISVFCCCSPIGPTVKSTPEAVLVCGPRTSIDSASKWDPALARPSTAAMLQSCDAQLGLNGLSPLLDGFGLPPIDIASGILRSGNVSFPLPLECSIRYRNLRTRGMSMYSGARVACAELNVNAICAGEAAANSQPAARLRLKLESVTKRGVTLANTLRNVQADTLERTRADVCNELSAMDEYFQDGNGAGRSPISGFEPWVQQSVSLEERVRSLEEIAGARITRHEAEIDGMASRLAELDARTGDYDIMIDQLVQARNPAKCLEGVRTEVNKLRGRRQQVIDLLREQGFNVSSSSSVMSELTASLVVPGSFAPCSAHVGADIKARLSAVAVGVEIAFPDRNPRESGKSASVVPHGMIILTVSGFADQQPLLDKVACSPYGSNYALALARAQAIAGVFAETLGSRPDLRINAKGEDGKFIDDCNWSGSEECQAKNRRFEVHLRVGGERRLVTSACNR